MGSFLNYKLMTMYPDVKYPSVNLLCRYSYIVRDEVPSFWFSCRCAELGMLVQGRCGDTLGDIQGRHWGGQVGCGVAALPVLGGGGGGSCALGLVSAGQDPGR